MINLDTANDNKRPAIFDATILRYIPGMRNRARRYPWLSLDDAVQETVVMALSKWRQYRPDGNAYGWLCGIMANVAEAAMPRMREVPSPCEAFEHIATPASQEYASDLRAAIDAIPADRREIIISFASGESARFLAKQHGVSAQAMVSFIKDTQSDLRAGGDFLRPFPATPAKPQARRKAGWQIRLTALRAQADTRRDVAYGRS